MNSHETFSSYQGLGDYILVEKEMGNGTFSNLVICTNESCVGNYMVLVVGDSLSLPYFERDIMNVVPNAKIFCFKLIRDLPNRQSVLTEVPIGPTFVLITSYIWDFLRNSLGLDNMKVDVLIEDLSQKKLNLFMLAAGKDLTETFKRKLDYLRTPTLFSVIGVSNETNCAKDDENVIFEPSNIRKAIEDVVMGYADGTYYGLTENSTFVTDTKGVGGPKELVDKLERAFSELLNECK